MLSTLVISAARWNSPLDFGLFPALAQGYHQHPLELVNSLHPAKLATQEYCPS